MNVQNHDSADAKAVAWANCGKCGRAVPSTPDHGTWCECGWNLAPARPEPSSAWERLYAELGRRRGQSLFSSVAAQPSVEPGWTLSRVVFYGIGAIVHALTAVLVVAGLVLVVRGAPNLLLVSAGITVLLVAWALRPRFASLPPGLLDLRHFPTLNQTVRRIADALGTRPPTAICISSDFNAHVVHSGLAQTRVLVMGLPLLAALDPQEKVALIAHELAHFSNGDVTRGRFGRLTLQTLGTWHELLYRDHLVEPSRTESGDLADAVYFLAAIVSNFLLWILSFIPYGLLWLCSHLLFADSQRAEYLADLLGARLSGKRAFIGLLTKLTMAERVELLAQRAVINRDPANILGKLRTYAADLPPRELERLRRTAELEDSRLDATHPPTGARMRLLEAIAPESPQITLTPRENSALRDELSALEQRIHESLLNAYRRTLYY